ncbi:MAG: tetratricopeptide repeat protein [Candidatus Firestonebacteria bacterium]
MRKYLSPAILLFSLLLLVYTACPAIYVGDDGELDAAAYTLGVGHPPGYPVFTLLSHLFARLPVSNVAFRINLLSVFFGALSIVFLYLIMRKLLKEEKYALTASVFTALMMLLGETFWVQALHSKGGIYILNILFILGFILTVQNNKKYLFGLLLGFSLANHHTVAVVFLGLLLYIYYFRRDWLKFKALLNILSFSFVGLCAYFYLIVSANTNPPMNWGNPYNFDRMIYHIFRKQYGELTTLTRSFSNFYAMTKVFVKWLLADFTIFPLLLAFPGIYAFYRKDKKVFYVFLLLLLSSVFGMMYVLNYEVNPKNVYINKVFFIPAFAFIAVFAGFGYKFVAEKIKYTFAVIPLLLLPSVIDNIKINNLRDNKIAYNYGINILKSLEKNAIFFCEGDNQMFILGYLKYVDKIRPDVIIYDDMGIVFKNIYGEDFLKMPQRDRDILRNKLHRDIVLETARPIYIPIIGGKEYLFPEYKKEQHGIIYKLVKGEPKRPVDPGVSYNLYGLEDYHTDYFLRDVLAQYFYAFGVYYMKTGDREKALEAYEQCGRTGFDSEWVPNNLGGVFMGMGDREKAIKYIQKSISNSPSSAREYTNMGVMYYQQGDYDKALEYYNKAVIFNPNYAEAYNGIGTVYSIKGMDVPAIKAYENAIALKPDYLEPLANMGILYYQQKQFKKAAEYYNKALVLNPLNPEVHNNLGVAYENMGDIDGALIEYKKATELDHFKVESRHNLGVIYYRKKIYKEALREWELVFSLKPDYPGVKENIQLVKKALNK